MSAHRFTLHRLWAIVIKEFIQMKRDRLTFGMMVGIPLMQLMLFGFAINSDPKHLPTAILSADEGPFTRTLITAMQHSEYFEFVRTTNNEEEAQQMLQRGEVQFVVNIPVNFSRKLLRGEQPSLLLEADATDPSAVGPAVNALRVISSSALNRDLTGPHASLRSSPGPIELRLHAHYNPENITQYNIVPGLLGVVLTMTMVVITALAITRERERGTMENLLSTPVRPFEVMLGKIIPYIVVGYIQLTLILLAAHLIFEVPLIGSIPLLYAVSFLFISASLAVGITFSTLAKNQLQAMQMAFFFFLPSILLSGFMFPFRGMPEWAQWIGSVLPLTHFLQIVRGILLKGNGLFEIAPELGSLTLFFVIVMAIGVKRYRQTLD
jgi:ABC-2 type transport system permease protein